MCLFGKCLVLGISMVEIGLVHICGVDLVWEWSCLEMAVFGSGTAWTCQPLGKALYMRFLFGAGRALVFLCLKLSCLILVIVGKLHRCRPSKGFRISPFFPIAHGRHTSLFKRFARNTFKSVAILAQAPGSNHVGSRQVPTMPLGTKQGIKQKLKIKSVKRVKFADHKLGKFLKDRYVKGSLSAADVAKGCATSSDVALRRVAKLAPSKKRVQRDKAYDDTRNTSRGVMRELRRDAELLPTYEMSVPMWDWGLNKQRPGTVRILPPHEVLDTVVLPGQEASWCSIVSPAQQGFSSELAEWGDRMGIDVSGSNLPFACLGLWGDSAPHVRNQKDALYLLTFTVVSGTHRKRFWVAGVSKHKMCQCCTGRHTFDELFSAISWSCRSLAIGRWPSVDHLNVPFAPGTWRHERAGQPLKVGAAVLAKTGDWAWMKQCLGMEGWQGSGAGKRCCWICDASLDPSNENFAYNFSADAPCWKSHVTTPTWWQRASSSSDADPGSYISKLWSVPGFRLSYIKADWMHCCCLGVLMYAQGNCMYELWKELGGNYGKSGKKEDACGKLFSMCSMIAKSLGCELSLKELSVNLFRASSTKAPRFRLKAAQGRYFLPVLVGVMDQMFDKSSPHQQTRLSCMKNLLDCYHLFKAWDASSPAQLAVSCRRFLILYVQLNTGAKSQSLWKLYPKMHLLMHVAEAARVCPAHLWNYSDEDEIGRAAALAAGCNKGHIERMLLEKYRCTFCIPCT